MDWKCSFFCCLCYYFTVIYQKCFHYIDVVLKRSYCKQLSYVNFSLVTNQDTDKHTYSDLCFFISNPLSYFLSYFKMTSTFYPWTHKLYLVTFVFFILNSLSYVILQYVALFCNSDEANLLMPSKKMKQAQRQAAAGWSRHKSTRAVFLLFPSF